MVTHRKRALRGFGRNHELLCRTVFISFSQVTMRFQVGMLWDANTINHLQRVPFLARVHKRPLTPCPCECQAEYLDNLALRFAFLITHSSNVSVHRDFEVCMTQQLLNHFRNVAVVVVYSCWPHLRRKIAESETCLCRRAVRMAGSPLIASCKGGLNP